MAAIDYNGITDAIRTILQNEDDFDALERDVRVIVDKDFDFDQVASINQFPCVYIKFIGRSAVLEQQTLSAAKRLTLTLEYEIWCVDHAHSAEDAERNRNTLLGLTELVLLKHATLNGTVSHAWQEGGILNNAGETYICGGQIRLFADATMVV